ncbi:MAG: ATPase P [Parcubacteria group bacterium]|nr:ATPase P [Parcubacteria group bacterium]
MSKKKHTEILKIDGMTCANCALGIRKHLEKNGVQEVAVNFITSEASFAQDSKNTSNKIIQLINELGYQAQTISLNKKEKTLSSLEKKFIFTLFFTLPLFSHMFLPKVLFLQDALVQFVLCLPVFIVGLMYFGKSALSSLRSRLPNMDVLIMMGSSAAFLYSIYGWLLFYGTSQVHNFLFFETTATIITLVLLGNVLEHRSVKQTTTAIAELSAIQIGVAKIEINGEISEIPFDQIRVNDILIVNEGDKIPVDGILVWGEALIDESMLTGESIPVNKEVKSNVIGGTIVTSGSVKIKANSVGKDMLLSQIIELVKNAEENKPNIQSMGDKVSAIFVPIVFGISVLTFFISHVYFAISMQDALLRAIAVLVISCPCAMGLATPTAVMVGIGRAAKKGILLKGVGTLEKLASIKRIVFDKTGTLTTGDFSVKKINILEGEEQYVKSIIFNLEKHSSHPIAVSLVKNLESEVEVFELEDVKEEKGIGISAKLGNDIFQIGSSRLLPKTEEHDLFLLKNNKLIATIEIEDGLKSDTKKVLLQIKDLNINSVLLSGDKRKKCEDLNEELHFSKIYAEQLPHQKLEIIEELVAKIPTAMFGDGINDAPALARATIGISIGNATQVAIQSADVILLDKTRLHQLPKALHVARHTLLTIKQNLFWAFAYNIVAIPIAALGFLNPMWGALFMAFSDVVVIGNSIRLKYKKIF